MRKILKNPKKSAPKTLKNIKKFYDSYVSAKILSYNPKNPKKLKNSAL